jgi:hypothetical protein
MKSKTCTSKPKNYFKFYTRPVLHLLFLILFGSFFVGNTYAQSINLDQAENGGVGGPPVSPTTWTNGNLNANNSHYAEGQSVAYRVVLSGLSLTTHTLDIEWDIRVGGKNALDYITSFQRISETVNPAAGYTVLSGPNDFSIANPPVSTTTGTVGNLSQPTTSFNLLPASERKFTIYNGNITSIQYINNADGNLGDLSAAASSTRLRITFTAASPIVILAWGGHIGSRLDWGENNSASQINGSPYHTRIIAFDGSGGNQDRSLSASAVCGPAVLLTDLVEVSSCGTTANFSTTASGDPIINFLWKIDGNAVSVGVTTTSTTSAISINPSSLSAGTHTVSVTATNNCGTDTKSSTLIVKSNVAATSLAGADVCLGAAVSFSTTASGTGPFTYVWEKDGQILSGETGSSLAIASAGANDAGTYSVTVSGSCGAPVTRSADLSIKSNVAATSLAGADVCLGAAVSFSTTASGTGPFTYVWEKDGQILSGETGSSLAIASAGANDAGTYSVTVSGSCGAPVTRSADLSIKSNVAATSLVGADVCLGAAVSFSTTASGTDPFTYVWEKDGQILSGETGSSLAIASAGANDAGTYSVTVSGSCGAPVTRSADLSIKSNVAATSLVGADVCLGSAVSFSTTASGTGPFTYVWEKDGQILSGETGSSLAIASVVAGDAGTYSVTVSGSCGAPVTRSADLSIKSNVAATSLVGADVCLGSAVSFSTTASGTGPFTYVWEKDGQILSGETGSSLAIASVVAGDAGTYSVTVSGSCGAPVTRSADLSIKSNVAATSLVGADVCLGAAVSFSTTASGTDPFTYVWEKDGQILSGETGSSLAIASAGANDAGTYSVTVSGSCGAPVTRSADLSIKSNVAATSLVGADVCLGAAVSFSTTASGTGPFTYVWEKDGQILSGETGSSLAIASAGANDAGTYSVTVSGSCGAPVTRSADLSIKSNVAATSLAGADVCLGAAVSFSTTASGTGPFTYVWEKDGQILSGETGSSLAIASVVAGDAGTYSVTVSGSCGDPVVKSATLIVNAASVGGDVSSSNNNCLSNNSGTVNLSHYTGTVLNWQYSVDNGLTWVNVSNITSSLTYSNLAVTTWYRAVVQNATCNPAFSTPGIVTVINCDDAYCTYTQGYYGNFNGTSCNTATGGSSTTLQKIQTAINATGGSFVFGKAANNKYFTLYLADANNGKNSNIFKMLPGGTDAKVFGTRIGGASYGNTSSWSVVPLQTSGSKKGAINNSLFAQTLALYFNLYTNAHLGTLVLSDTLVTEKFACGSASPAPLGNPDTFGLPHNVIVYLSNSVNGYSNNVEGLFKLANDVLGGANSSIDASSVSKAVDVINNAFDGCRLLTNRIDYVSPIGNPQAKTTNVSPALKLGGVDELSASVTTYPNPYTDRLVLTITSKVSGNSSLELYDLLGRKVSTLYNGFIEKGAVKTFTYYNSGKSSKTLVYKFSNGKEVITGKVISLK